MTATPMASVTVTAAGRVEYYGQVMAPAGADLVVPGLADALGAFRAKEADSYVLLAGDRRADFRVVRSVLLAAAELIGANSGTR